MIISLLEKGFFYGWILSMEDAVHSLAKLNITMAIVQQNRIRYCLVVCLYSIPPNTNLKYYWIK